MKNMDIALKMVISFSILTILTIGIVIGGVFGITQLNSGLNMMYDNVVVGMEYANNIKSDMLSEKVLVQQYADSAANPARQAEIKAEIEKILEENNDRIVDYAENVAKTTTIVESGLIDEETLQELLGMVDDFTVLNDEHFNVALKAIISSPEPSQEQLDVFLYGAELTEMYRLIDYATDFYTTQAADSVELSNSAARMIKILIYLSLLAYIIVSGLFIIFIPRSIAKPLAHLVKVADAVAVGDLSVLVKDADRTDEVGKLSAALKRMKEEIRRQVAVLEKVAQADLSVQVELRSEQDTMGQALKALCEFLNKDITDVRESALLVSGEADNVASQSQELAQGTTEQAASVEQLSSAFFEISLNTKESSNLAKKAATVSDEVKTKAVGGTQMMQQMIEAVEAAAAASKDIDKIIKVIEEISFQTNILALNAAVEAAHAGQNGSGFAVVAAEVRSLASKSAASAKETSILIGNTLDKVQQGADIANDTALAFRDIVEGIMESTNMITDIAKFSEEQATAIEQINSGIGQVAQVIHINSGAAEECAAAAEKMRSQAKLLEDVVAKYKVGDNDKSAAITNATAAAPLAASPAPAPAAEIKIDLNPTIPTDDFGKY